MNLTRGQKKKIKRTRKIVMRQPGETSTHMMMSGKYYSPFVVFKR